MANQLQVLNTCQSYHQKDSDMRKFNVISYEQELEAAGVPKEQAAVHARALGQVMTEVAFSSDLKTVEHYLRQEIFNSEQRLSERLEAVRETLNAKIDAAKIELNAKIDLIKLELGILSGRISAVERELTVHRWLFGLVITLQAGTLAAVIKLLPH